MRYIELVCHPQSGHHTSEVLIARLAEIGFESFSEGEHELFAYIPAPDFNPEVELSLATPVFSALLKSYEVRHVPDQNWNAVWESEFDPVLVAGCCLVRAPFHEKPEGIAYDIVIEPKMSFGTAHHETTQHMLRYVLKEELLNKSLLDMGSGTAVLAILAAMRGAGPVTAIDNDEWAYNNAVENVAHNKPGAIEVLMGDSKLLEDRKFDVILANINRNILLNDMPAYRESLLNKGILIMSGFYEEDLPLISAKAAELGLKFVSSATENRWTAARFVAE